MDTEGELTFLRMYKEFIYHFNMLDRNMGYWLIFCMRSRDKTNTDRCLLVPFQSKVKGVLNLAEEAGIDDQFSPLRSDLEECRHVRSIITHDNWEWSAARDKPIRFHAPDIAHGKGEFTNDEFKSKLMFLIRVPETFKKLRAPLEAAGNN